MEIHIPIAHLPNQCNLSYTVGSAHSQMDSPEKQLAVLKIQYEYLT